MKCPVCTTVNLLIAERQGVEIDYCPQCRGVWLDRGELDKIIERASLAEAPQHVRSVPPQPDQYPPYQQPSNSQPYPSHHGHHANGQYGAPKHHRKKSMLEELFDFG
jgi:Zn-finger nucleic acid-binding protein